MQQRRPSASPAGGPARSDPFVSPGFPQFQPYRNLGRLLKSHRPGRPDKILLRLFLLIFVFIAIAFSFSHGLLGQTISPSSITLPVPAKNLLSTHSSSPYSIIKGKLRHLVFPSQNGNSQEISDTARNIALSVLHINRDTNLKPWQKERLEALSGAIDCKIKNNCTPKQKNVVISVVGRWKWSLDDTFDRPATFPNGEAVLGKSWISAIHELGYPFIHLEDTYGIEDPVNLVSTIHNILGDHVKIILMDYVKESMCMHRYPSCLISAKNPTGIPEWKIFQWDPLSARAEPEYRRPWSLKTSPASDDLTYIGFEMESSCDDIGFVPHSERPNTVYIFGKERDYFDPQDNRETWRNETYERIIEETGVRIQAGILDNGRHAPTPFGIENVGTETRKDFIARIGTTRLVIGTGRPHDSPTPMEGLCAGTPFINMIWPDGGAQHPMLSHLKPPYVYNVLVRNEDALLAAIREGLANPLKAPFILPQMTKKAFLKRLEDDLLNRDWETLWRQRREAFGYSPEDF